jgi:transcriptional regulator with XRE-family HTH domain
MGRTSAPYASAVTFGERVRARRKKRGWSQERLAEECGLHATYISDIEQGRRNPSLYNVLRLAAALGADPATLVKGLRP